jgi:tRNA threonylcarbamoyladenosine biosynthesis protein TsaB
MPLVLCLETSTRNCSVAVGDGRSVLAAEELNAESYVHAEQLHPFIDRVLKRARLQVNDLDGVAVGKGPGSYTGLRIGVAAAKGLCFASGLPLLAMSGPEILAAMVNDGGPATIVPMIDAGRMEVYTAKYDSDLNEIYPVTALTPESDFFATESNAPLVLCGDGAEKFRALVPPHVVISDVVYPSATAMIPLAISRLLSNQTEDLAYFEPFYLKDFVAKRAQPVVKS